MKILMHIGIDEDVYNHLQQMESGTRSAYINQLIRKDAQKKRKD